MDKSQKPRPLALSIALQILRALLVIAPLAWIYSRTDAATIAAILGLVSLPLMAAAAALSVCGLLLQGVKWWVLIHRFVPDLKLGRALSVHLESTFYAIALPSTLAQDVVKSVMLAKSHAPEVVWAASWLGRLIALFSLLLCAVLGAVYIDSGILPAEFRVSIVTAAAVIILLCALSFSKRLTRPLGAAAAKIVPASAVAAARKLRDGIYAFKYERATLATTLLISAAVHLLAIASVSIVVYALSGSFRFVECLVFVPLVEIMAVSLPLTPGGVGIREALMALLFARLGLSEGQVASYVTISLLLSMTRAIGSVPVIWRMLRKNGTMRGAT